MRGPAEAMLDAEADPPRVRVTLRCTPAVHEQWLLAREFAERVSGQCPREDEALEWVTAEALSAVSIDAVRIGEPDLAPPRCAETPADDEPPLGNWVRAPVPEPLANEATRLDPLLAGRDEADAFSATLDHALATGTLRDPSNPPPDPVFERDGFLCAVPGCSSRMSFHDHHVVFRSHQGSNDMGNLRTLCASTTSAACTPAARHATLPPVGGCGIATSPLRDPARRRARAPHRRAREATCSADVRDRSRRVLSWRSDPPS